MLLYPDVQQRAQEELSAITDRLPESSDSPHLPYIQAVMLEVLRWEVVIPLGVSHAVTSDDEYCGFHIPANSAITVNIWAIFNDPNRFPDPREFRPERFLTRPGNNGEPGEVVVNQALKEVVMSCFGFGRRICPGRFMAMESLWLSIASVLSVFNIRPSPDEDGRPSLPQITYEPLFIRKAKPFQCSIEPRSEKACRLIEDSERSL
ncbi:hypothetical protein ONZ45_g643 [Pleurotus djamor]|nr:hypothetical protein ONZ45_g643 [Pleurotus djamor]